MRNILARICKKTMLLDLLRTLGGDWLNVPRNSKFELVIFWWMDLVIFVWLGVLPMLFFEYLIYKLVIF